MTRFILPERPLDPTLLHVLRVVSQEAERAGIKYMLVGATARDLLLTHVFDGPSGRATYDADFVLRLADSNRPRQRRANDVVVIPRPLLNNSHQNRLT